MTTKAKAPARTPVSLPSAEEVQVCSWLEPAWTLEERLQRIRTLGQRINSYIQFMCNVGSLNGSSAEAKDRAVTAFYERLLVVESQLGRIHDDLRLG